MSIQIERGELDGARQMLAMFSRLEDSTDVQDLSRATSDRDAALQRAEGRLADALADAERDARGVAARSASPRSPRSRASSRRSKRRSRSATPRRPRSCSLIVEASARRDAAAVPRRPGEPLPRDAWTATPRASRPPRPIFRELGLPFWLAVTLLEHGELTGDECVARRGARDLRATEGDAVARAARCRSRPRRAEVHA